MLIGYARVSTEGQNLRLQEDALTGAGCERIFTDQISAGEANRPGLERALSQLRSGDSFVVWKLDRLGRSVLQLTSFIRDLDARGVHFRSLTDNIDTKSAGGRFMLHMLAAFAELERDLIRERTRAGLDAARARGRQGGRPPTLTPRKVANARRLLGGKNPPRVAELAHDLGVTPSALYRALRKATSSSAASTATAEIPQETRIGHG